MSNTFIKRILATFATVVLFVPLLPNAALATSFSFGSLTPTAITANVSTTMSISYSGTTPSSCNLYMSGVNKGGMSISSSKASYTGSFAAGTYSNSFATCIVSGATYNSSAVTITVTAATDTTAPVVNAPTVSSTTETSYPLTFSSAYSDNVGVTACEFYFDGADLGAMTLNGSTSGTATKVYTVTTAGTHTAYTRCSDAAGHTTYSALSTFTIYLANSSTATVGAVYPTTATQNTSVTLYATFSSGNTIYSCDLFVDNVDTGAMSLSSSTSGTAYKYYTFTTSGNHTAYARCSDVYGNMTYGTSGTVNVSSYGGSSSTPVVTNINPSGATLNQSTSVWATVTDAYQVSSCQMYINGNYAGAMSVSGSSTTGTAVFTTSGNVTLMITCADVYGHTGSGSSTVYVYANNTTYPSAAPYVASVWPTYSAQYSPVNFSVTVSAVNTINSCNLYINDLSTQAMSLGNGYASTTYTFANNGAYKVQIKCVDVYGNTGYDSSIIFPVTEVTQPGMLVKTQCGKKVYVNDPCTTVYYVGQDYQRHAFPNEKTYKTWYSNYSNVQTVSASTMASWQLGKNVTYRPAVRLVKFPSSPMIYAVSSNSTLRPITSPDIATALYGSNWNTKIDDISEAFYSNYTIGSTIYSTADYSIDAEYGSTTTINGNL